MQELFAGKQNDTLRATTEETARQCTIETDNAMLGQEEGP